jgi:hypothetical protein
MELPTGSSPLLAAPRPAASWPTAAARAGATLDPGRTSPSRAAASCFSAAPALQAALRPAAAPDGADFRAPPFSTSLGLAPFHSSVRCRPVLAAQFAAATTFSAARALLNRAALGAALEVAAAFGPTCCASRFDAPQLDVAASLSARRSLLAARSSALLLRRALRLPAPTLLLTRRATALGAGRLTDTRLLLALLAAEFISLRLASWPRLFDCRTTTLRPLLPTGTGRLLALFSTEFFSLRLTLPLLLGRGSPSLRPLRRAGAGASGLLALLSAEFPSLRLPARPLLLGCRCAPLRPLRLTLAQRCRT